MIKEEKRERKKNLKRTKTQIQYGWEVMKEKKGKKGIKGENINRSNDDLK